MPNSNPFSGKWVVGEKTIRDNRVLVFARVNYPSDLGCQIVAGPFSKRRDAIAECERRTGTKLGDEYFFEGAV